MYIKGFSPSKLNTFTECEQKYLYKYVHYLPEDYNGKMSTDALQFGSYVHKILEDGVKATNEEELWEHAHQLRGNYTFKDRPKDLEKCIKNFFKFNSELSETLSTEMRFHVNVLKDLEINGIIDRVVVGETGKILVIDYKTSKREKSKRDLYNDPQMILYTAAISKLFEVPINDVTVAHYYPITGNLVTIRYLPSHVQSFLKKVDKKKWKIRKKKKTDFKPRVNRFCDWCGYKELCPAYGGTEKMLEEALGSAKANKSKKT